MTTDIPGSDGAMPSGFIDARPASAIADAGDGYTHLATLPLKTPAEPARAARHAGFSADYDLALSGLTEAAEAMANDKNVPLPPEECAAVARVALDSFRPDDVMRIARCRPEPVALAASMINRIIDVLAAERVIMLIYHTEGITPPDRHSIVSHGEAWMRNLAIANRSGDMLLRWPDPAGLVAAHYRASVAGPVKVTLPHDQTHRARYYLDRAPDAQDCMHAPLMVRLPPPAAAELIVAGPEGASQ